MKKPLQMQKKGRFEESRDCITYSVGNYIAARINLVNDRWICTLSNLMQDVNDNYIHIDNNDGFNTLYRAKKYVEATVTFRIVELKRLVDSLFEG